jgi:hypothetical protein
LGDGSWGLKHILGSFFFLFFCGEFFVLEGAVWDFWFGVLFFLAHDEHDGLYVWYGDVIFMKGVVWRAIEGIVSVISEEIGKLKHCSFLFFCFVLIQTLIEA